jgi:hypothetical protein
MMGDASQRMIGIGVDITDQMNTQGRTSPSASEPLLRSMNNMQHP